MRFLILLYSFFLLNQETAWGQSVGNMNSNLQKEITDEWIKKEQELLKQKQDESVKLDQKLQTSKKKELALFEKLQQLLSERANNKILLRIFIDQQRSKIENLKSHINAELSLLNPKKFKKYLVCMEKALSEEEKQIHEHLRSCNPQYLPKDENLKKTIENLLGPFQRDLLEIQTQLEAESKNKMLLIEKQNSLNTEIINKKRLIKKGLYGDYFSCSPKTPTIDLEAHPYHSKTTQKGPFHDIPHDHQDGIGSCFANTAKNLLVGLSYGKINASFLDMALQYKAQTEKQIIDIDGGSSCNTLRSLKQNGYCPQELSPLESGNPSNKSGGLFAPENNLYHQADVLEKIKKYLRGKSNLEFKTDERSKKILMNTKSIVKKLKENPDIQLPFPEIDNFPINSYGTELLYLSYEKKAKQKNIKNSGAKEIISRDIFWKDLSIAKQAFFSKYAEVLANGGTSIQKKDIFKKSFANFLDKYHLGETLSDTYLTERFDLFFKEENHDFVRKAKATKSFYREILTSSGSKDSIEKIFDPDCSQKDLDIINYTTGIQEITKILEKLKLNETILFESNGDLKSNKDLLMLAIAPKCLNERNRKEIEFNFTCQAKWKDSYQGDNPTNQLREDIIDSLIEGMPIGNSFPTDGGHHINTIIGYRFNKKTNNCELKIRESQTGSSSWVNFENQIKKTQRLIYVTR